MMEKLLEVLVGQLPEAIYFALFLLFTKEIKEKRILFTVGVTFIYLLLFNLIRFSIWEHILFFAFVYLWLKVLYKERAQIIDIFTLGIASIIVMLISLVLFLPMQVLGSNYIAYVVVGRICLFIILFIIHKHLHKIQQIYKKCWNRNDKIPKKIKSATFRVINTVTFNIMFFCLSIGLTLALVIFGR